MTEISHVVFATDLSESSDKALQMMRYLWPRLDGKLTLLHVAPDMGMGMLTMTEDEEGDAIREKRDMLGTLAEGFGNRCEPVLLRGDTSRKIADFVNGQEDVGLLVLGRHYYSRLQRLLTGVVADIVIKEVTCPVLRC